MKSIIFIKHFNLKSLLSIAFVIVFTQFLTSSYVFAAYNEDNLSSQCLVCHQEFDKTLFGSVHQISNNVEGITVSCSGCHDGVEAHIEDPDASNITNPANVNSDKEILICKTCHFTAHQQRMNEGNAHAENNLSCSSCHKIHNNKKHNLLIKKETELCFSCHSNVEGSFAYPSRHPLTDGIVTCTDCHKHLDESAEKTSFAGINTVCFKCHSRFQGPFPYEHRATVDYSTEEGGCLNCHEAHGASLPRMLKQSYESPAFALCSQCHLVPSKHRYNGQHGAQWADQPCYGCHTDIHGSYFNKFFLSQDLEVQGCLNIGCHQR